MTDSFCNRLELPQLNEQCRCSASQNPALALLAAQTSLGGLYDGQEVQDWGTHWFDRYRLTPSSSRDGLGFICFHSQPWAQQPAATFQLCSGSSSLLSRDVPARETWNRLHASTAGTPGMQEGTYYAYHSIPEIRALACWSSINTCQIHDFPLFKSYEGKKNVFIV